MLGLLLGMGSWALVGWVKQTQSVSAASNCPPNFKRIGDFCISTQSGNDEWKDALEGCYVDYSESRLCSSSELIAAFSIISNSADRSLLSGGSWSSDLTNLDGAAEAVYINYPDDENEPADISEEDIGNSRSYYCCRNL